MANWPIAIFCAVRSWYITFNYQWGQRHNPLSEHNGGGQNESVLKIFKYIIQQNPKCSHGQVVTYTFT